MLPLSGKESAIKVSNIVGDRYLQGISQIICDHVTLPKSQRIDTQNIIHACVAIAGSRDSISGFQYMHHGLPSHTTCLNVLHKLDVNELVEQSSNMLISSAKRVIRQGHKYTFAIDIVKEPYYGQRDGEYSNYIVGGKRKASTNYFFGYLTLYICDNAHRITLLAVPWTRKLSLLEGVTTCIELIRKLGLKIRCLCMDREFYVTSIFRYLQEEGVPHIVPVKEAGVDLKNEVSGNVSKFFSYKLNKNSNDALEIAICDCVVYLKGKRGKHGKRHHAFVICNVPHSFRWVREVYSQRFGIESSYRMKNIPKAKTCSKDPGIRYFYSLVSYMFQNTWIQIQWDRFAKVQRGPKVVRSRIFQLKHLISIIQSEILNLFPIREIKEIAFS